MTIKNSRAVAAMIASARSVILVDVWCENTLKPSPPLNVSSDKLGAYDVTYSRSRFYFESELTLPKRFIQHFRERELVWSENAIAVHVAADFSPGDELRADYVLSQVCKYEPALPKQLFPQKIRDRKPRG